MSFMDSMQGLDTGGSVQRITGLVLATVRSVDDPEGEGKVQLDLVTQSGRAVSAWAPIAAPMAGDDRGLMLMPEVNDVALVGFLYGHPEHPYVLGFLWNGQDKPPTTHPRERILRSFNGHTIRMIDEVPASGASGALVIEDAHGNTITMSNGKITIKSVAVLELDAPVITLAGPGWRRVVTPNANPI